MIIKEFISNLSLLISSLFLYTQWTSSSPLTTASSFRRKVLAGTLAGFLSIVLMEYSMVFGNTIVDLRHIPVILVAYYGGTVPALISMGFIIIGRFSIGVNSSSILAFVVIGVSTLLTLWVVRWNVRKEVKVFAAMTVSQLVFSAAAIYLIRDAGTLFVLIPSYWLVSYIGGAISFYVIEYSRRNQRVLDRYRREASTDSLTGLQNVRKFDETFNMVSDQAREKGEPLSLLYVDIDHFKHVNDTYGHKEGDQVLRQLGSILTNTVRSFDIVSRNGGEEFTILLLDSPLKDAASTGERIREAVEDHPFQLTTGKFIHVTISVGVSSSDQSKEADDLLTDADKALYRAKRTGRNKVCRFQPEAEWT